MVKGIVIDYDDRDSSTLSFWKKVDGKFISTKLIAEAYIFDTGNSEDNKVLDELESTSEYFCRVETGDEYDYAIKHNFSWEEFLELEDKTGIELMQLLGLSEFDYRNCNYANAAWLRGKINAFRK